MSLWTGPGNRAGALRPNWIGKNVQAINLDEHRSMINKGHSQNTPSYS